MKIKISFLICTVIILTSGCIPSLHPLYTEETTVIDKHLDGNWKERSIAEKDKNFESKNDLERSEKWHFEKAENGNYYWLTHVDTDGNISSFDIHLVKLGDHEFFDFYPNDDMSLDSLKNVDKILNNKKDFTFNILQEIHYRKDHTFAKVKITADQLEIKRFDPDWIEKLFEQRKIRIKHEVTEEGIILTAPSIDLQKFIIKYAEDEKAYNATIVLERAES